MDDDEDEIERVIPISAELLTLANEINKPSMIENIVEMESVEQEGVIEPDELIRKNRSQIDKSREKASKGQKKQAVSMLAKNKKQINSFKVGDLVLLRTDGVDRGAADAPNIICRILEKKEVLFKLGCDAGILNVLFPFNVIDKIELRMTLT